MGALEPGIPAPHFTLKDATGKPHELADALKQGPVLLVFYKESCPTCQFTLPFLERLHRATAPPGRVQVWGVSQDDPELTTGFAAEYGCSFPLLVDEDGYPVSNAYGLTIVPTLVLIETDGRVADSAMGFDRRLIDSVAARLGRLAGQSIEIFRSDELIPDHRPG